MLLKRRCVNFKLVNKQYKKLFLIFTFLLFLFLPRVMINIRNNTEGDKPMMNLKNKYQRLYLQQLIDEAQEVIDNSPSHRANVFLDDEAKGKFFKLSSTLKTFLSEYKNVLNNDTYARDYLKMNSTTAMRICFSGLFDGFRGHILQELIDNIERVADEHFGTVEEAIKVEDVVEDEKRSVSI